MRQVGAVGAVGFAFVISIAMGAGLGYALDRWLGTAPWLFLIGFVLGVAAGVLSVFRVAASASQKR
jgi:ATP synthase protein I